MKKIAIVLSVMLSIYVILLTAYKVGYSTGYIDAEQETSDDLLVACENKIDEIYKQYNIKEDKMK